MVALVTALVARLSSVEARLEKLENQQKKTSRNSSKPPSGDGFGKRTKSLRKKSERSSGGQKGHRGSTLDWHEQVDEVVTRPVTECSECGASLSSVSVVNYDRRQVHELPPLHLQVIEHQVEVKCCPACAEISKGAFPVDVTVPVQYGSGLRGLMVYLRTRSCYLRIEPKKCLAKYSVARFQKGRCTTPERSAMNSLHRLSKLSKA